MIDQVCETYYLPNKLGRIILQAMEEITGRNGFNATLKLANLAYGTGYLPPDNMDKQVTFGEVSQMQSALEHLYGIPGGRGVALRSGRVCFKHGLREFGIKLGFTESTFRLLPLKTKMQTWGETLVKGFNENTDQRVKLVETESHYQWVIERCPVCWGRHADRPICHMMVGLLQESFYWVSGGKFFQVEEVDCIAKGDPTCRIQIEKGPLE